MNQSSLFIDALKNHDRAGIISAEKSDIHNHVGRGGNAEWLSRRLNVGFSPPPEKFSSLSHMQDWFERNIKPFFIGREGIMLRWEACFA